MLRLGMIVDWIHDRSISAVTADEAAVVIPSPHGCGGRDVGWGSESTFSDREERTVFIIIERKDWSEFRHRIRSKLPNNFKSGLNYSPRC